MEGKRFYYTLLQEHNTAYNHKKGEYQPCKPYLKPACDSVNNGSFDGRYNYATAHRTTMEIMKKHKQSGFTLYYGTSWHNAQQIITYKVNPDLTLID